MISLEQQSLRALGKARNTLQGGSRASLKWEVPIGGLENTCGSGLTSESQVGFRLARLSWVFSKFLK